MRPGAWLVRIVDDGLLVNFRSYLNYHFPAADHTVLHISFSSVEWVRQHRIERTLPDNAGEDETSRQRYLELKLSPLMTKRLERNLAQERQRKGPVRPNWKGNGYSFSRHYPVQVINDVIRIEWGVKPGIWHFLDQIRPYVIVHDMAATSVDFRALASASKAEQERQLIDLVQAGKRMHAIRAARRLYKMDLTEAVRFIDELAVDNKP